METFPVFQAAQRGLIDQDTCYVLLETQLVMGGLLHPDFSLQFSLEEGLDQGLIDTNTSQGLSKLESALLVLENTKSNEGQQQNVLPVSAAMECGSITEEEGLRILELQMNTGGLRTSAGLMNLKEAAEKILLTPQTIVKLQENLQRRELVDPNTAELLNLYEIRQRCVSHSESGLLLLPVQQETGGTVCLSSGREVLIFHAAKEGLIDRQVALRLLEAQLFAGGIVDPRSGDRLTVNEAVHRGLMDQGLACSLLARQLQNGGILDPLSGERLDLDESIRRDLLSSGLAPGVLESLWAFAGMLWPESGEIIPIAEALEQGVISGELSRNILRHRHAIGSLYHPETLQVLPLTQTAERYLDPTVVIFLKDIHIPDVLPSRNQSVKPEFNSSSRDSTCSAPPPLPHLPSGSPEAIVQSVTSARSSDPEEELKRRLLVHLIAHSYVDAHSGKRLLLLDPELSEIVKANILVSRDFADPEQVGSQRKLSTYEQRKLKREEQLDLTDQGLTDAQQPGQKDSTEFSGNKEFEKNDKGTLEENNTFLHNQSATVESEIRVVEDSKVKRDIFDAESKKVEELKFNASCNAAERNTEEDFALLKDPTNQEAKPDDISSTQLQYKTDACSQNETFKREDSIPITLPSNDLKDSQDMELERLAQDLKQEGLLNLDGNKLLPDEAVAQGLLSGYMAVQLMAEANLFGGFVDASSGQSVTMDEVAEGIPDEDLMWRVLKSDKTLSGVVDVDKNCVCSITEAGQTGLIDPDTTLRLLEAQVVSGGIVDLSRNEKVSVVTAAKLGLIKENQKDELMPLERAYNGKNVDSAVSLTKASLQLQMDGVVDPESKSPVPLEQAIQKNLIKPSEAYEVLTKQVAEGGILHHASGLRLSVSEAVDRGIVSRSIASGLQELEWIFKGKLSPSSHPEAFILQASTGAIVDPESGCKLTLTEAVFKGLLDDSVADEAMTSSVMTQGVLDPQSAQIVPFSELVKQGTIDIETGQRFLAVKPFRGIQDEETGDKMTLPEAVASKKVDPIPSFRLLQSQANSGGVVDIATGERLSLAEAGKRGLIEDDMVRLIATGQFLKGGIIDPVNGKHVSNLDDAVAKGLISSQTALDILEETASGKVDDDEAGSTSIAEELSRSDVNTVTEEIIPESERIPKQIQEEKVQGELRETGGVEGSDKDSLKEKTTAAVDRKESSLSDESKIRMYHQHDDRHVAEFLAEEMRDGKEGKEKESEDIFVEFREVGKGEMAEKQNDDAKAAEKPAKMESKFSIDDELPDQCQASPLKGIQSKSKKRDKKKKKDKESMKEAQLKRKDHSSQIDQVDTHIEGQSDHDGVVTDDLNVHIHSQKGVALAPNQEDDTVIEIKTTADNLLQEDLIADPSNLKYKERASAVQSAVVETTGNAERSQELKREKKDEGEKKPSVSQDTEQLQTSQGAMKGKEVDLPLKHAPPEEEKAALIQKAKESILKKGFGKGASRNTTANELQTSCSGSGKGQHPALQDVTLSPELKGEENLNGKDETGRKQHRPSQFANPGTIKESGLEPAAVKADAAMESFSEKGATETIPLTSSSNERDENRSPKGDSKNAEPALSKEKHKDALYDKQGKKKKKKSPKLRDGGQEKLMPPENVVSDVVTVSTNAVVEKTDLDKPANKHSDDQSASDVMRPSLIKNGFPSPSDLHQPQEPDSHLKGHQKPSGVTSAGREQLCESEKSTVFSPDAPKSNVQPTGRAMEFEAQPDKTTEEDQTIKQPPEGSEVPEGQSVKDQKQNSESSESEKDSLAEYESLIPERDTATDSEEDDVNDDMDSDSTWTSSKIRKVTCLLIMCGSFFLYLLFWCTLVYFILPLMS